MRSLSGVLLLSVFAVAGCTAAPAIDPTPTGTAVGAESFTSSEEACAVLSDVGTIVFNFDAAQREGRLIGSEYNGAMRLAARLLGRIDLEPGTQLADVVHALQGAAPAAVSGARSDGVKSDSEPWLDAWSQVVAACNEAIPGSEFAVEGWVGG